jgi:predicted SPOUT superfamily RNA methylase MTH1
MLLAVNVIILLLLLLLLLLSCTQSLLQYKTPLLRGNPETYLARRLHARALTAPGSRCCACRPSQLRQTRSQTCALLTIMPLLACLHAQSR